MEGSRLEGPNLQTVKL